jgi:hypothetical protein
MTSAPIRDPLADHLITPQNAALLLIDYQPAQVASVRSMDPELIAVLTEIPGIGPWTAQGALIIARP